MGHACTARPSGQSRLFSGQAGDVTALGAAGVESTADSEVRKSEEGVVHLAGWANSPAGIPQGPSAEEQAECGGPDITMKAVTPTPLAYTHRVLA